MKLFKGIFLGALLFFMAGCESDQPDRIDDIPDDSEYNQDGDDEQYTDNGDDTITLTFLDHEGSVKDTLTIGLNDDFTLPEGPNKEGHYFVAWDFSYDDLDFETNQTIEPIFELMVHEVTINGPEGVIDHMEVEHGVSLDLNDPEAIDGYRFIEYDNVPSSVVEDITIEALYEAFETITVNFHDNQGNFIESISGYKGVPLDTPAMQDDDASTFDGWATSLGGETIDLAALTGGTHDLYAVYSGDAVTVYFDFNDGSEVIETTLEYGSYVTIDDMVDIPEYDHLTFMYWEDMNGYWYYDILDVYQMEPMTLYAQWEGASDEWLFDITDDGAKLRAYLGDDTHVTIPSDIEGIPVGIVGEDLFNSESLKSLTIGDNVHTLEDRAFRHNDELDSVVFEAPDAIRHIGDEVFSRVPANNLIVPAYLSHIGERAFYRTNVTSASFNGVLTFIGDRAFYQTTLSGDIAFPSHLQTIEAYAFRDLDITSVTFNDGLQFIGAQAFENNSDISELILPSSVETIEQQAFKGIESLTSVTFEPGSALTSLEMGLFEDSPYLATFIFPDNLKTVHGTVFANNDALVSVELPSTADDFRNSAFADMLALETFEVPEGVEVIEPQTFRNTPNLATIVLPESLEAIHSYAFSNSGVKSIDLSENVTEIRAGAFSNASALETITLPDNLEVLQFSAFRGAKSLEAINIPQNIETIENNMFNGTHSLKTVHLHDNLKEIEHNAFEETYSLESMILPSGLHTIGHSVFKDSGIDMLYIPLSVDDVGTRMIENASNVYVFYEGTQSNISAWHWNFNPDNRPVETNASKPDA